MGIGILLKMVKLSQSYFSSNNEMSIKDLKGWEKRKIPWLTFFSYSLSIDIPFYGINKRSPNVSSY